MKQFALMSLVLTLLILSGQAFAIPIITLDPRPIVIHSGEYLLVDVNVSGLQSGGANSLLGAFSMDVLFEPNPSLDFIQLAASTFDNALGKVSAGEAIVGTDPWVPGSGKVSFYEVSLLDSAALAAKQSDSFRLATLIFYLPYFNTLPSGTPIILSTANVVLSDDLGNQLATGVNPSATVSVSEPPVFLLLGFGLALFSYRSYKSRILKRDRQTLIQSSLRWMELLAISIFLCISSTATNAATKVQPIPDGNINLTISSTSAVNQNYYITAGQYAGWPDSIIPMKVNESVPRHQALFQIVSSQNVKIRFVSDKDGGPTFYRDLNLTPGFYHVNAFFHSTAGDFVEFAINKQTSLTDTNPIQVLHEVINVDTWGELHFKTGVTSNNAFDTTGAEGILQTVATDTSQTSVKAFLIPNSEVTFNWPDLWNHTIVCTNPENCSKMTRVIKVGSYGEVTLTTSNNGTIPVTKTVDITPYDRFVFTSDVLSLQITHTRLTGPVPVGPPTINLIPNPAPITYRDGLRTIQLQGISDGTPDETQGLTVTATSSNPAVIPAPSISYLSDNSTGTLSYHAVQGAIGSSNITVTVTDDGGTPSHPSDDSSTSVSFTVKILANKPCDGARCLVYVGQGDHVAIDVIDAATNEIVNTIPVSLLGGLELAITPDGNRVYAIGFTGGSARLSIIDTQTNAEIGTLALPSAPSSNATSLALTPDGGFLYVTMVNNTLGFDDVVLVINTATNTVVKSITLGNKVYPDGLAFSPNGARGYITTDSDTLLVLDTMSQAVIANIAIGAGPHHLAVTPDGGRVYVVNLDSNSVSVINATTNQIIGNIAVGYRPEGIAITPDGRLAYVSVFVGGFSGHLEVIDTATNAVTKTIFLNGVNDPREIGITPDGTRAYVTFGNDRSVSMVAIATNQVVETIPIGTSTIGIAISGIPLFTRILGDINRDGSINKNDIDTLLIDLNKPINGSVCGLSCDLDGDGKITVLDARRLVNLCSKPKCATN